MADIDKRVEALEKTIATIDTLENSRWKKWEIAGKMATPIAVAILTVAVSIIGNNIQTALREQELNLSTLTAMETVLGKLLADDIGETVAQRSAGTLASFGEPAVLPLVQILRDNEEVRRQAAEHGLQIFALTPQRGLVCETILDAFTSHSALFLSDAHLRFIRLFRVLDCKKAVPALKTLEEIFPAAADKLSKQQVKQLARKLSPLDNEGLSKNVSVATNLRKAIYETLEQLQ